MRWIRVNLWVNILNNADTPFSLARSRGWPGGWADISRRKTRGDTPGCGTARPCCHHVRGTMRPLGQQPTTLVDSGLAGNGRRAGRISRYHSVRQERTPPPHTHTPPPDKRLEQLPKSWLAGWQLKLVHEAEVTGRSWMGRVPWHARGIPPSTTCVYVVVWGHGFDWLWNYEGYMDLT